MDITLYWLWKSDESTGKHFVYKSEEFWICDFACNKHSNICFKKKEYVYYSAQQCTLSLQYIISSKTETIQNKWFKKIFFPC